MMHLIKISCDRKSGNQENCQAAATIIVCFSLLIVHEAISAVGNSDRGLGDRSY